MLYQNAATPQTAEVLNFVKQFDAVTVSTTNATQSFGADGSTGIVVRDHLWQTYTPDVLLSAF